MSVRTPSVSELTGLLDAMMQLNFAQERMGSVHREIMREEWTGGDTNSSPPEWLKAVMDPKVKLVDKIWVIGELLACRIHSSEVEPMLAIIKS